MKHGHGTRRGVWAAVLVGGTILTGGACVGAYAVADVAASPSDHSSRTSQSRPVAAVRSSGTVEMAAPRKPSAPPKRRHRPAKRHMTTLPSASRSNQRTAAPEQGGGDAGQYAEQVVALVNSERGQHGCGAVSVNPKLTLAAQRHSDDMVARHFFSHTNPDGAGPGQRITATGYRWSTWGENIAYGQKTPADVMNAWMNSPGHRANILNCAFQEIGVGVNLDTGTPYWTQDFGAP